MFLAFMIKFSALMEKCYDITVSVTQNDHDSGNSKTES